MLKAKFKQFTYCTLICVLVLQVFIMGFVSLDSYATTEEQTDTKKVYSVSKYEKSFFIENEKKTHDEDNDITITKDESKLNLDKVIINVRVPENKYTTIMPDANSSISSDIKYEVTENGVYAFEFLDSFGKSKIRVVHVNNIQSRKNIKTPKVNVVNGVVKLEADKDIEYSIDNKRWEKYVSEIEYKEPIYARVIDENAECHILKITINENGELKVEDTNERVLQKGILTSFVGISNNDTVSFLKDVEGDNSSEEIQHSNGKFKYMSEIPKNIEYTFSAGKTEEDLKDISSNITYKDINNNIFDLNNKKIDIKEVDDAKDNIDYCITYKQTSMFKEEESSLEIEQKKLDNEEIVSYEKIEEENEWYWKEICDKYAYVDKNGDLNTNIDILNEAKSTIEQNNGKIKFTKIIGDGKLFYLLTEQGNVYFVSNGEEEICKYIKSIIGSEYVNEINNNMSKYIIFKLDYTNIIDIYDSCTALTSEGEFVSLIKNNEKDMSAVQAIQKQTDKYLVQSHLGLKDGKLYNFKDVYNATEVNAGKIIKADEPKFGVYSKNEKAIKLLKNESEENIELQNDECYIDVKVANVTLPKFVDIAELREGSLLDLNYRVNSEENIIENKCYAISESGQIWLYLGGYIVDTGVNIEMFGPTINYTLNNTKWTNENLKLNFEETLDMHIDKKSVEYNNNQVSNSSVYTIDKNGKYTVKLEDKEGRSYFANFDVDNIDKVKPNIVYRGNIENGAVNIVAYDEKDKDGNYASSGAQKIELTYDDPTGNATWVDVETSKDEKGNINAQIKKLENTKYAYVRTIDNAGNVSKIKRITFKEEVSQNHVLQQEEMKAHSNEYIDNNKNGKSNVITILYICIGLTLILSTGILCYKNM